MLDMIPCRSLISNSGYSLSTLKIPQLNLSPDLRDLFNIDGGQTGRNNINLLFLPCAHMENSRKVEMFVYSLSQRENLDNHKHRVRNAVTSLHNYTDNTTAISFVNFKSINMENRAALKDYVSVEFTDAQVINSRYMVVHPQCDVAVYKFTDNKFLILTNTFTHTFLETVYAMLWINHGDSTATPELADALLRGEENTIVDYINSLITVRIESMATRTYEYFTDKFKGIMLSRDKLAALERALNSVRNDIERANNKLLEQLAKRKDILLKIKALQTEPQDTTIEDLLLMIKPEDIVKVNEEESNASQIYFVIKSKFTYWDEDDYKIMRDRRITNTNFLSGYSSDFIGFLDEIFVNKNYTLTFDTPLCIYTYDNGFATIPRISRGLQNDANGFISNPHIYHYNCWGDNESLISRAFEAGDFITGWCTIVSAISAVNMTDTPVMTRFVNDLYRYATDYFTNAAKQIIKNDGTMLTISQAYTEYISTRITPENPEHIG